MSQRYPQLPFTTFPNSIQEFPEMMDIEASDGANIKGFQDALEAGDMELARQYYAQIPNADRKFITSTLMNQIIQTTYATMFLYLEDIYPWVKTKQTEWQGIIDEFSYKQAFNLNTQYKENNYVLYSGNLYIALADPPVGTYPNNTTYWRRLTIEGLPGPSGTNMSFTGDWINNKNYSIQDVVAYGSALWGALQPNIGRIPAEGSAYWQLIFRNSPRIYPVQASAPTEQSVGDLWFEVIS